MHMRRVNKNSKPFEMKTARYKRFIYDQIAARYFIRVILLSLFFLLPREKIFRDVEHGGSENSLLQSFKALNQWNLLE